MRTFLTVRLGMHASLLARVQASCCDRPLDEFTPARVGAQPY